MESINKDEVPQERYYDFLRRLGGAPLQQAPVIPEYLYDVYVAGSLRNPSVLSIHTRLAEAGLRVFSDWFAAGPEADDYWKQYYKGRGLTYEQALREPASVNTFMFDKRNILQSRTMLLVLPAGKSGHLELGCVLGGGRKGFILLEEDDPERWDVMYQFATLVTADLDKIVQEIKK